MTTLLVAITAFLAGLIIGRAFTEDRNVSRMSKIIKDLKQKDLKQRRQDAKQV